MGFRSFHALRRHHRAAIDHGNGPPVPTPRELEINLGSVSSYYLNTDFCHLRSPRSSRPRPLILGGPDRDTPLHRRPEHVTHNRWLRRLMREARDERQRARQRARRRQFPGRYTPSPEPVRRRERFLPEG